LLLGEPFISRRIVSSAPGIERGGDPDGYRIELIEKS
jgi:hypothetical protein